MEVLITEYKNGIFATETDHESLKKAIIEANSLNDSQIRAFSENSILLARELFSPKELVDKFIEL